MDDHIICPHCKKPIPLSQALSHELKEKLELEKQREVDLKKKELNEEAKKWKEDQLKKMEGQIKEKSELEMKDKINEIEELRKQNKTLQEQLLEMNTLLRQLKFERDKEKIENEKKLNKELASIRETEKKRSDDENRLRILEKEKQLNDALKVNEELKRKLQQGSQQMQGEVLELELETILKKEFPYDEIKEVPKGVTGADIIQVVKNNFGRECGSIIWEFKRTKAWTDGWVHKLREDQRRVKADLAVIISQVLPQQVKNFTIMNGVWIGNFESVVGLALLLRNSLIEIATLKLSMAGKQEKKEILWNYLTSLEFRQRLDSIYDAMNLSKEHLEKEKEFFRRKWAREEKNLSLITENLLGMHGDLQAIVGKSLPEIAGLKMLPEEKKEDTLF